MRYYADKQKKYIGGNSHGKALGGAVFQTVEHPDFWNDETVFIQIADIECDAELEVHPDGFDDEIKAKAEGGEDLGKQQG